MAADQATLEATASAVATKVTYGGGITSAFGLIATIDWIGWVGVCVAIIGLAINTYFQIKRDRREEAESNARMKSYSSQEGDD